MGPRSELQLNDLYLDWICSLVYGNTKWDRESYNKLIRLLHDIPFEYSIPLDGNRVSDGLNLRYRFGYEEGYSDVLIASLLDNRPCSVLEMLAALSLRCEEHIMDHPDEDTNWFWEMISNLGLSFMTDLYFDEKAATYIINKFMRREHEKDGRGGLFYIPNYGKDLRNAEIWYQLNWYLEYINNLYCERNIYDI